MLKSLSKVAVGIVLVISFADVPRSQSISRPDRGTSHIAPFDSSGIENVNLENGNVSISIPLASLPKMAGGKLGFTIFAQYNSKLWDTRLEERVRCVPGDGCVPYVVSVPYVSTYGGWRIGGGYSIDWDAGDTWDYQKDLNFAAPDDEILLRDYNWTRAHLVMPDGSKHEIRPLGMAPFWGTDDFFRGYYKDTPDSTGAAMSYYTADGSYTRVTIYPASHPDLRWEAFFPDGTKVQQFQTFQRISDANGNKIKIFNDGQETRYQDEHSGREIRVGSNAVTGKSGVSYQSVGGTWQTVEIVYGTTTVSGKFHNVDYPDIGPNNGCVYQEDSLPGQIDLPVVREIKFPAPASGEPQATYAFSYNADVAGAGATYVGGCGASPTTHPNPSLGWGELSSMTTPLGAVYEYEYYLDDAHTVGGTGVGGEIDAAANTISEKRLNYDGMTDTWDYLISPHTSTVTGPSGAVSTITKISGSLNGLNGLVVREDHPNRTRIERQWGRIVFDGAYEYTNGFVKLTFNPVVTKEFTSLLDASGNATKMSARAFQYDFNGNVTQVSEYDWFDPELVGRDSNGVPIDVPPGEQPVRTVSNNYHNSPATWNSTDVYAKTGNLFLNSLKETSVGSSISRYSYDGQVYGAAPTLGNLTSVSSWDNHTNQWIATSTTYDTRGNVESTTDANGTVTQFVYGSIGGVTGLYPTQTISASGTSIALTSSTQYDFHTGLPVRVTDEDNGVSVESEYDILGRNTKTITAPGTPLEQWTTTEYSHSERRIVTRSDLETVGDGRSISVQHFDRLGRVRLSRVIENASNEDPYNEQHGIKVETKYMTSTQCGFDSTQTCSVQVVSNPFRASNSSNASNEETMGWTRSSKNSSGLQTEIKTFVGSSLPAPLGANENSTGSVLTNVDGDRVLVTDQAGKRRISKTNALGQLEEVWEVLAASEAGSESVAFPNTTVAHGFRTAYGYDTLNNLTTVSQGVQTRTFSYSSLSRLLSAANPESGTISYQYDPNGNLTSKTDARSITTTYSYDALNRVTQRSYSGETGYTTPTVNYTYGTVAPAIGRLTKVESSISTTEYTEFDILGRIKAHKQTTDGQDYTTGYVYNLSGALIEQTYPSGRKVKSTLDADGNLAQVHSRNSSTDIWRPYASNFVYTAAGAVSSMKLGNGRFENTAFNSRLQPTQIGLGSSATNQGLLKLNYDYGSTNNNGNVLSQTITVPTVGQTPGFTAVQNYTYDSLNRLKSATENIDGNPTPSWQQTYTFDRYGNRNFDEANTTTLPKECTESGNPVVCEAIRPIVNPSANAANNRLSSTGWQYDAAGNTTVDAEGRQFTYDAENKQVKVKDPQNQIVGEYFYNGDGLRIKKVVPGTGETTIFAYDASNKLVAEYSTVVEPTATAKTSYLTTDHLGSPRITTDQFGQVASRRDFMPYGEEIARQNYGADSIRQKFTSYERDNETDLDFAQARFHSFNLGRFTSPDPLMASARRIAPQTFNRYTYSLNSPLRYVDPSGLIACPPEDPECYTDEDGEDKTGPIKVENEKTSVPGCGGKVTDECAKYVPQGPAAGFVGPPPPPVVAPGAPAPVTAPPPGAAPSVGRTILSNVGRAVVVAALAPAAIILAAPVTVQAPGPAPAGQTSTTTTTTSQDRDPLQRVYRVWGGGSRMDSDYWTPIDPRTVPNYRDAAGLPDWNTGEYLVEGDVRTSNIREITVAKPLHGNQGGIIEYRINPANVMNKVNTKLLKPL